MLLYRNLEVRFFDSFGHCPLLVSIFSEEVYNIRIWMKPRSQLISSLRSHSCGSCSIALMTVAQPLAEPSRQLEADGCY